MHFACMNEFIEALVLNAPDWDIGALIACCHMIAGRNSQQLILDVVIFFLWCLLPWAFVWHHRSDSEHPERGVCWDLEVTSNSKLARSGSGKRSRRGKSQSLPGTSPGRKQKATRVNSVKRKLDRDVFDSLKRLDWVSYWQTDGSFIEVLIDPKQISEQAARTNIMVEIGLSSDQFQVDTFVSGSFEYLNGDGQLSIRQQLYFRSATDNSVKTCTVGWFENRRGKNYAVTSGHGSSVGTIYYRDQALTKRIGRCRFCAVDRRSDIAFVQVTDRRIKQVLKKCVFHGTPNREVFPRSIPGDALAVLNHVLANDSGGKAYIHCAQQTLPGRLNVLWNKEDNKESLGIDLRSAGGATTCEPGDSGSLVTSRLDPINGIAVTDALGLVSGIGTVRSGRGTRSVVTAFPMAGSIQKFQAEKPARPN